MVYLADTIRHCRADPFCSAKPKFAERPAIRRNISRHIVVAFQGLFHINYVRSTRMNQAELQFLSTDFPFKKQYETLSAASG